MYNGIMSRDGIVEEFYRSGAWQKCRAAFIKAGHQDCARCLAKGLIQPTEQVHHIIRLTPDNVRNPAIALNFKNLEGLCENCHKIEHGKETLRTDANGHVEL